MIGTIKIKMFSNSQNIKSTQLFSVSFGNTQGNGLSVNLKVQNMSSASGGWHAK